MVSGFAVPVHASCTCIRWDDLTSFDLDVRCERLEDIPDEVAVTVGSFSCRVKVVIKHAQPPPPSSSDSSDSSEVNGKDSDDRLFWSGPSDRKSESGPDLQPPTSFHPPGDSSGHRQRQQLEVAPPDSLPVDRWVEAFIAPTLLPNVTFFHLTLGQLLFTYCPLPQALLYPLRPVKLLSSFILLASTKLSAMSWIRWALGPPVSSSLEAPSLHAHASWPAFEIHVELPPILPDEPPATPRPKPAVAVASYTPIPVAHVFRNLCSALSAKPLSPLFLQSSQEKSPPAAQEAGSLGDRGPNLARGGPLHQFPD